jgi:hypothetical protein
MKILRKMKYLALTALFAICSALSFAASVNPASAPMGFKHQYAVVNGVKIHYVIGGKGEPLY